MSESAEHAIADEGRLRTARAIDRFVFAAILVLAALPFGRVYSISLGIAAVSASEIILAVLVAVLAVRIVFVARSKRILPVILLCVVVGYTIVDTIMWRSARSSYMIFQIRGFLPFPVAALLLASGTTIAYRRVLLGLAIAGFVSASSVLFINRFAPGFIQSAFFNTQFYTSLASEEMRVYWPNAALTFLCLVALVFFSTQGRRYRILAYIAAGMTLLALFSTLNRTYVLGVAGFGMVLLWQSRKTRDLSKVILILVSLIVAAGIGIATWLVISPSVLQSVQQRFIGSQDQLSLQQLYSQGFASQRLPLYRQYLSVAPGELLRGKGLGTPFASGSGVVFITTDVSFLSFLLPYGLPGLAVFVLFLVSLYRAIPKMSGKGLNPDTLLRVVFWISLLVSLNVDIYSRDSFVVFFTLAVVSLRSTQMAAEHKAATVVIPDAAAMAQTVVP